MIIIIGSSFMIGISGSLIIFKILDMNSRERVLLPSDHMQPDRVPVDMGATPSSGISAIAYSNLVQHI